jgi:chemotaxis protein CheZ
MSADTEDLQALFDRVAAESTAKATRPAPAAAEAPVPAVKNIPAPAAEEPADVFHRIGTLTRSLHDALCELGYDKVVENAVTSLPDARDRLEYIGALTGKAAERALVAAEAGLEEQKKLDATAARLASEWDRAFEGALTLDDFKATAVATRSFLKDVTTTTRATNAQFTEVIMAQDFHDLTGQVIQRIVKLAQNLEGQLVQLLIETTPPEKRRPVEEGWLNGPVVNTAGRTDIVTNQAQVDDLLESLGF